MDREDWGKRVGSTAAAGARLLLFQETRLVTGECILGVRIQVEMELPQVDAVAVVRSK